MNAGDRVRTLTLRLLKMIRAAVNSSRLRGADADDLAQDAGLRLLAKEARWQALDSGDAYVRRTVKNLTIDKARRVSSNGGEPVAIHELPDTLAPWIAADQEAILLVKQVILALPPIYRDTFVLNRFIGLTYAEIADRQGITVKAVEYRMSRALALCAEALRD